MKEDYQEPFKKLILYVNYKLTKLTLLKDKTIKNKRGLELLTGRSSCYKTTKQVQKHSFISNVLSDQVWWCNIKQFVSYSKNYICKFIQANWWHHKLFHFHLSFGILKLWKGREKNCKNLNIENEKSFFDEIKNISYNFSRTITWWKNEKLKNIPFTSFKVFIT